MECAAPLAPLAERLASQTCALISAKHGFAGEGGSAGYRTPYRIGIMIE